MLAVSVNNLCLDFGGKTILDHTELEVESGEILCIWGPSGEGKSTFLRVLGGLEKSSRGMVRFFGQSCDMDRPSPLDSARTGVGFIFQNSALISNMNVMNNIVLPLRFRRDRLRAERAREHHSWQLTHRISNLADEMLERDLLHKAEQAMRNMLVYDYRNHFPHELSIGVQRRVALARALALDPKVLLMDEPTSGLDFLSRLSLLALITNMSALRRLAVVLVTHDLMLPKELGAKVSVFQNGKLTTPCRFHELKNLSIPFVEELLYEIESAQGDESLREQTLSDSEILKLLRSSGTSSGESGHSVKSIF